MMIKTLVVIISLFLIQSCGVSRFIPFTKPPGVYHTVQKNQTLWRICTTYGVDMQKVIRINRIADPSRIKEGDRIFIPGAKEVMYVRPVTARTPQRAPARPRTQPPPSQEQRPAPALSGFIWPVNGRIIETFGMKDGKKHDGINIQAPAGTHIKAAKSGSVIFSARLPGHGNTIILKHEENYVTVYGNNRENIVRHGQWVNKGSTIATVGTSGNTHYLHFQIRRWNIARNPLHYLPKK